MWPDTEPAVQAILDDMRRRAETYDRQLKFGYRAHVIVRETEEHGHQHEERRHQRAAHDASILNGGRCERRAVPLKHARERACGQGADHDAR